jgi:hypothetical protein
VVNGTKVYFGALVSVTSMIGKSQREAEIPLEESRRKAGQTEMTLMETRWSNAKEIRFT